MPVWDSLQPFADDVVMHLPLICFSIALRCAKAIGANLACYDEKQDFSLRFDSLHYDCKVVCCDE